MSLYPVQDSFVRGEVSPRLHARASLDLYRSALSRCENFVTLPHGGIRKRSGTYFVQEAKTSAQPVRLIDFKFSEEQAYCLEFGHNYMRVHAYGAYTNVEIATPFPASSLFGIQYVQSADVMWLVHPSYAPRKLTRVSATVWTIDTVSFRDGPFAEANSDESKTATVSAATGVITINASSGTFSNSDVGRLFRIEMVSYANITPWEPYGVIASTAGSSTVSQVRYNGNVYRIVTNIDQTWRFGATPPTHLRGTEPDGPKIRDNSYEDIVGVDLQYRHSGFGVARITAVTNSSTATATVLSRFPDEIVSGNSYLWSFGAFGAGSFPVAVTLFEERLFYANKLSVYGSRTGNFENFRVGEKDDDALAFVLAANEANDIVWLADADGFLAIGTIGGLRALSGSGIDEALTPSSFKNRSSATPRCARQRPLNTGQAFLYVMGSGRAVAEVAPNSSGRFEGTEASQVSEHLPKMNGGIVDSAYQEMPDSTGWFALASGRAMGFTYQRDQEVRGFHQHPLADGGIVESVAVTPNQNGADDVWFVVRRTVNGTTRRYVEIMEPIFEYQPASEAFFLDCGLSYSGSAVGMVSGLSHLIGKTVSALADGRRIDGLVVSSTGAITLPNGLTAERIHVGLPYEAAADTLELDVGGRDGSLVGRRKKVTKVILSLFETDTSGLTIASMQKNRWEKVKVPSIVADDGRIKLFTGNVEVPIDDSWEGQGRVTIRHAGPGPCTIRAMTPAYDSEGF